MEEGERQGEERRKGKRLNVDAWREEEGKKRGRKEERRQEGGREEEWWKGGMEEGRRVNEDEGRR